MSALTKIIEEIETRDISLFEQWLYFIVFTLILI